LSYVFNQKSSLRPKNAMIVGASGSGKTALIDRFMKKHDERDESATNPIRYSIIKIQMPHEPDPELLLQNIYEALRISHAAYDLWRRKRQLLLFHTSELLKGSKTRLVMVEDLHLIRSVSIGVEY
jgi:Cdc6-like AAA superfamily ATPase